MVSATRVPNSRATYEGPLRFSECPASWIDRSHHLLIILQVLASAQHGCSSVAPRVWLILDGTCRDGGSTFHDVFFARKYHLPGDACGFVCQRHGSQLRG